MLRLASCVLALSLFLLVGCHSHGGYGSVDPTLTYGPGVVEFPDPVRAYLPAYAQRYEAYARSSAPRYASPADWHSSDVEVIYVDDSHHRVPPPPPPSGHWPGDAYETPAKSPRRVRRAPGQPLGVEFTD